MCWGAAEEAPAKRPRTRTRDTGSAAQISSGTAGGEPALSGGGGAGAWRLRTVQPWADKAFKPAQLTEEQAAHLAEVAKEKAEKEAANEHDKPVRAGQGCKCSLSASDACMRLARQHTCNGDTRFHRLCGAWAHLQLLLRVNVLRGLNSCVFVTVPMHTSCLRAGAAVVLRALCA